MLRVRVTCRTFPKKNISAFQLFFLQRLLSQRHAQKCCVEYSNIYLFLILFKFIFFYFYFYYIFYFNIFLFNYWFIIFRIFGTLEILPSPSTLDPRRSTKRQTPTCLVILTSNITSQRRRSVLDKEGRKEGGGKRVGKLGSAIQVKHLFLLKHSNVDSVYFSARALNFNAISKLFITFVTDFWQCIRMKIIALWNLWSLARWQRNCWWKERETAHLVWEILTRALEGWGEDRSINYLCQGIASKISTPSMMSSPTPTPLMLPAFTIFAW